MTIYLYKKNYTNNILKLNPIKIIYHFKGQF